jgi:hypothetical protein
MYGQYDGYPSGVGMNVLNFCRQGIGSATIEKVINLKVVSESDEPTTEEASALSKYSNGNVSTGSDWYATLRETQGNPEMILESGYILNSFEFGFDGLFCEWGYVLDLDNGNLDVYRGFFQYPSGLSGLWDRETEPGSYFPIQKIASFSFDSLPSDEEFLALEV